jgi:hypothetical protein
VGAVGPSVDFVPWPRSAWPPATSHQPDRQIIPLGISGDDQPDLPGSGPAFQAGFPLDGGAHVTMLFGVGQAVKLIAAGECRTGAGLVRTDTIGQIARYAEIQRSVRSVGHDVNPAGGHGQDDAGGWLRKGLRRPAFDKFVVGEVVGGRAKPGHDTCIETGRDASIGPGNDLKKWRDAGPHLTMGPHR